jgi:hypothetical protein
LPILAICTKVLGKIKHFCLNQKIILQFCRIESKT